MPPPLLYYTVPGKEIRPYMPNVPVLLSAASCAYPQGEKIRLRPPRLPTEITLRAADSGGFAAMMRWGGRYPYTPRQYVNWLAQWQPKWAATMDLGVLDPDHTGPPDPEVVKARQEWTTAMAWHFWRTYRDVSWAWVPTLHGYTLDQYREHARALAPLLREMFAFYAEVATFDEAEEERLAFFRVGIGSLCKRPPKMIAAIAEAVSELLGTFLPLHCWGCKLKVLQAGQALPGVVSLDTAAWNQMFGPEHEKRRVSGLSVSEYSWLVSQPDYARKVALTQETPQQLCLFGHGLPQLGWISGALHARFDDDEPGIGGELGS
jgi:hypothetical protein